MTTRATTLNGMDVSEIRQWVEAMRQDDSVAKVALRTRHVWEGSAVIDGSTERLEFGGETIARSHSVRSDFPFEVGGSDRGPAPSELLLYALGACVGSGYVELAALAGVEIRSLDVVIDAGVDLRGAYDVADVRVGLSGATIEFRVETDADVLNELAQAAVRTSPVADSLANPVPLRTGPQREHETITG